MVSPDDAPTAPALDAPDEPNPDTVAHVRAIVFDIDGTLATASSTHLQALGEAAEHVLGVTAVFEMRGERPHLNGHLVAGWVDGQCFELLAGHAGLDWATVREETLTCYTDRYADLLAAGEPVGDLVPGVATMLDRLAEEGIPMGLSTGNASRIAHLKLAALGIGHHFAFSTEGGFGDLHSSRAQVAQAAITALPAARTVYLVGDTVADMTAALAAGAYGVGVCTGADSGRTLLDAGAGLVLADAPDLLGFLGLGQGRWFPKHVPGVISAADLWMDHR